MLPFLRLYNRSPMRDIKVNVAISLFAAIVCWRSPEGLRNLQPAIYGMIFVGTHTETPLLIHPHPTARRHCMTYQHPSYAYLSSPPHRPPSLHDVPAPILRLPFSVAPIDSGTVRRLFPVIKKHHSSTGDSIVIVPRRCVRVPKCSLGHVGGDTV